MKKEGLLVLILLLVISSLAISMAEECETDADCDGVCVNDLCVECGTDSDCGRGEECEDNSCVEIEERDTGDEIENAYACLEDSVKDKNDCEDLALEEKIFSLLALAYDSGLQSDCRGAIEDDRDDGDDCWPDNSCKIKETAQVLMAYERIGKSTDDIEEWLIENNESASDLIWYLQVESDKQTNCEVEYSGGDYDFRINENKKINTNAGDCLRKDHSGYWYRISENCYDEEFEVSCDENFKATLLYEKRGSDTIYVSNEVKSSVSDGRVNLVVRSLCFGKTSCDYEGSLWAALALSLKNGKDSVAPFVPYLMALSDESENRQYFPETFLFVITGYEDYYNQIVQEQRSQGFWGSGDDKYYDTALAMFSIDDSQEDLAKDYLIEVQQKDGCWPRIRDTAFLLYAAWPKDPVSGGSASLDYCEDYSYYCVSPGDCLTADTLDNFYCQTGVCCRNDVVLESCSTLGGVLCENDEGCSGTILRSSDDKKCCDGNCIPIESDSECETRGYTCFSGTVCPEGQKVSGDYSCNGGEICCVPKSNKWIWWVVILLILIVLVVLAIIFRNKLRAIYFKLKNKFKGKFGKGKSQPKGPPRGPPMFRPPQGRIMPRKIIPRQFSPKPSKPAKRSSLDKELDETLKKLKEMSK